MFRFCKSSGSGIATLSLPAGSFTTCDVAGLVNANCPPACCANGVRLNSNSTSIGM